MIVVIFVNTFQAHLSRPALLHLAAYEPKGFDQDYPDLLPPNPAYGSTADMKAMVEQAQARGHLIMPCTLGDRRPFPFLEGRGETGCWGCFYSCNSYEG